MAEAFLVRHGATRENSPRNEKMRGHSRIPLDPEGRDEAEKIGALLKSKGVKQIFYSPLVRAKETAEIIARVTGAKATPDPDLETWDPGPSLVGKSVAKVQRAVTYYESHPDVRPPGGDTTGELHARAKRAMGKIEQHLEGGDEPAAWVTHTRPILTFQAILDGRGPGALTDYWKHAPEPGSVLEVVEERGKLALKQIRGGKEEHRES